MRASLRGPYPAPPHPTAVSVAVGGAGPPASPQSPTMTGPATALGQRPASPAVRAPHPQLPPLEFSTRGSSAGSVSASGAVSRHGSGLAWTSRPQPGGAVHDGADALAAASGAGSPHGSGAGVLPDDDRSAIVIASTTSAPCSALHSPSTAYPIVGSHAASTLGALAGLRIAAATVSSTDSLVQPAAATALVMESSGTSLPSVSTCAAHTSAARQAVVAGDAAGARCATPPLPQATPEAVLPAALPADFDGHGADITPTAPPSSAPHPHPHPPPRAHGRQWHTR